MTKKQKENVAAWVVALRSGKYKQGRDALNKNDRKFCCLGVACEVLIERGYKIEKIFENCGHPTKRGRLVSYGDECEALPAAAQHALGLADSMGDYDNGLRHTSLAQLNDQGRRFATIADIIESAPEGLFK